MQAYIKKSVEPSYSDRYNANGRAYPDVALVSTKILFFSKGKKVQSGGMSASGSMWAVAVSLINDCRASIGKPALGFLNKRLYADKAVRAAMVDITAGSNPSCTVQGFNATVGWDSVSGFGVLDFGKLKAPLST